MGDEVPVLFFSLLQCVLSSLGLVRGADDRAREGPALFADLFIYLFMLSFGVFFPPSAFILLELKEKQTTKTL